MGETAALVLQLLITGLQHVTELSALLQKAQAEGRDVTPEELAGLRAKASASVDALDAAIGSAP